MCIRSTVQKTPLGISSQKCLRVTLTCCAFIVYCACAVQRDPIGVSNEISDKTFPELFYILLWTIPFPDFGTGQEAFIKNNCSYTNCFVTKNRYHPASFDAIAFNGYYREGTDLPSVRYPHQKYIYFNSESAPNTIVCNPVFDNFFNLTATYRLNSDIVSPYFKIKDRRGEIIGPKPNMQWRKHSTNEVKDIDGHLAKKLSSKNKAVAWFASHCETGNGRTEIVKAFKGFNYFCSAVLFQLQLELARYGLPLDMYGECGDKKCARLSAECDKMVSDYYFYLSFENSNDEDYVTEKLLRALQQYAVPVVLGGSDYSRFLPPGSYLQAYPDTLDELAKEIAILISQPKRYKKYFYWRPYYSYYDTLGSDNICAVCAALNDQSLMSTETVYKDFRRWWYPDFEYHC